MNNVNKNMAFLIMGNFFEEDFWAAMTDFSYISIGGIRNPIYSGQVWYDNRKGKFVGSMTDIQGDSKISGFEITYQTLKFTNKYNHDEFVVYHRFNKEKNYWTGDYVTDKGECGESKCVVTAVQFEKFFMPSWTVLKKPEKILREGARNKGRVMGTDVRLEIFKRGHSVQYYPVRISGEKVFVGKARDWKESSDPNFLKVLKEGKIFPDDNIIVFDQGEDENGEKKYCVTPASTCHF